MIQLDIRISSHAAGSHLYHNGKFIALESLPAGLRGEFIIGLSHAREHKLRGISGVCGLREDIPSALSAYVDIQKIVEHDLLTDIGDGLYEPLCGGSGPVTFFPIVIKPIALYVWYAYVNERIKMQTRIDGSFIEKCPVCHRHIVDPRWDALCEAMTLPRPFTWYCSNENCFSQELGTMVDAEYKPPRESLVNFLAAEAAMRESIKDPE